MKTLNFPTPEPELSYFFYSEEASLKFGAFAVIIEGKRIDYTGISQSATGDDYLWKDKEPQGSARKKDFEAAEVIITKRIQPHWQLDF